MFSELPKLLGRNFAIGFFLPFAILLLGATYILHQLGLDPWWVKAFSGNLVVDTTVAGLASWVGAIALLSVNRTVYRVLEGYGAFNPARLLGWFQRRQERRSKEEMHRLYAEQSAETDVKKAEELGRRRARIQWRHADRFPRRRDLLPTGFGNAIRAFETYPGVMYGLDDIHGWTRLLAVVPKDFREIVDDAKARTDFWLNQWLVAAVLLLTYLGGCIDTRSFALPWIPLALIGYALIASRCATAAAIEWGDTVKAAYDVYLPKLRKELELPLPADRAADRATWEAFSLAIIFRDRESLPPLAPPSSTSASTAAAPAAPASASLAPESGDSRNATQALPAPAPDATTSAGGNGLAPAPAPVDAPARPSEQAPLPAQQEELPPHHAEETSGE